jgi:hypothetical protein
VEERVRVRRLRECGGRVFAHGLLTPTLSSTRTWRRGSERGV